MTMEAGTRQEERVPGRVWTVRLAPYGRPSAGAVTLSCSAEPATGRLHAARNIPPRDGRTVAVTRRPT
ncbi:hypothetical protein ABZ726_33175, partial [Streptomyces hundungensis]